MQIVYLCLCIAIGVFSFVIVLNSHEEPSRLYPGSNVRFWATFPAAVIFLVISVWLFPDEITHIKAVGNYILLLFLVSAIIAYSAWVESGFQAGVGKRLMRAVVVNKQGKPVDFITALKRNVWKWVLFPLAPFSLHLMIRDSRRRSLHDRLAGTFVIWAPEVLKANQPGSSYEVDQVYERAGKK